MPSFSQARSDSTQSVVSYDYVTIERSWHLDFVMVNYDSNFIDDTSLLLDFPTTRQYVVDLTVIRYTISYEIHYANDTYVNQIRDLILANSINGTGTGTALNEEALEYQKENPDEPQSIFEERHGRSINADVIEEWLLEHPAVEPPQPGYIFYVFNFTEFDTEDHTLEHWYDYNPVDPDSGEKLDWWRLEWDNELNRDVKFQYAGFGGKGNIFVLDPSADQWYLRWARIWWGEPPYDDAPLHCTHDLDDVLRTVNVSTPAGKLALTSYLAAYLAEPVEYLFFPVQHKPAAFVNHGRLTVLVLAMDVEEGVSVNSLRWVTDADLLKEHLVELYPFIPWQVNVYFRDVRIMPEIQSLFEEHSHMEDGIAWVDGIALFSDIYTDIRPNYVNVASEDIDVFGVVFIKQNMTMYAYGRTYTGLGGNGQTCIWKDWARYYRPDEVTPREGVSGVQLHETMHAVGFGHTWVLNHYVGDFSSSPMGYFGMHNGTSSFDQNWVQSTYLDQMKSHLLRELQSLYNVAVVASPERADKARATALSYHKLADEAYNRMDWLECYELLMLASEWNDHVHYTGIDSTPPSISDFEVIPDEFVYEDYSVSARVEDDLSGILNVTAVLNVNGTEIVFPCTLDDERWSATIPAFEAQEMKGVWIYIEAYDKALNKELSEIIYLIQPPGDYIFVLVGPIEIIVMVAIGVVLLSFALRKRRSH